MATKQRNKRKGSVELPTAALLDAEEQVFLDAIAANVDDDAPRLVYADFLESKGDPRGELIQVQCQLDKVAVDDPRRAVLARRETEILDAHLKDWLVSLWGLNVPARFGVQRGCIETIAAPFGIVSIHSTTLAARAPLLSGFELTVDGQLDRVSLAKPKVDALARARHLHVRGRHAIMTRGGEGPIAKLAGLAALPFTQLKSLELFDLRISGEDLAAFLSSPHLGTLEKLKLSLRIDIAKLEVMLSASPCCVGLKKLDLSANRFGEGGAELLAAWVARFARQCVVIC